MKTIKNIKPNLSSLPLDQMPRGYVYKMKRNSGTKVSQPVRPAMVLYRDSGVELDDDGYVITKGKTTETNIKGVFACGDAQDKKYRQAIVCAGSGAQSAMDVEHFLQSLD